MKQLLQLCQQEEKKLHQLSQQKNASQQRLLEIAQQQQQLSSMVSQYHAYPQQCANPLLMQNSVQMINAIQPLQKKLTRQKILLEQEHQRVDKIWRSQLGRQQGINWFYQDRLKQRQAHINRQEQKQMDDLACRYQLK
ncbi:flagellar FliJ family protein [Shewanella sp. WPAGA9]|uniref:flagellar FliJ family protein n=1 Tax=Shewanella sp. ENK2 TaxID=2775245 RepID=UPI00177EDA59|nr:flagellar FliJ family protein [Shewanella sp. WPAGA9]